MTNLPHRLSRLELVTAERDRRPKTTGLIAAVPGESHLDTWRREYPDKPVPEFLIVLVGMEPRT